MATVVVGVVLIGVAVAAFALHGPSDRAAASPTSTRVHAVDASVHPGPLTVATVTPASGTTGVPSDATCRSSSRLRSAPPPPHRR